MRSAKSSLSSQPLRLDAFTHPKSKGCAQTPPAYCYGIIPLSAYSDEPVLVKPSAGGAWKRWLAIILVLGAVGAVVYVPFGKSRMEARAHYTERGERQGARYTLTLDGAPHTLELTWLGNQFAPVLTPAPAAGTTLRLKSRLGTETLTWNTQTGSFGPTTFGRVDPFEHYKLSLSIELEGRRLWQESLWAYGVHDTHGHSH